MTMPEMSSTTSDVKAERPFPLNATWLSARSLLLLMTLLELGWLAAIWFTGATDATYKLPPLLLGTGVVGAAIIWLPDRYFAWFSLEKGRSETRVLWLFGLLLAGGLLIFAAQQRVWPFDEVGNFYAARAVAEKGIGTLFENYAIRPWLGDQHPPLVPIMYGLVMRLVGVTQLSGRLITAVFALGTGWLTYRIGRRLFDRDTALLGAMLLFSFPLVFRLGAAMMVEMPLTFFFTLTVLLSLRLAERPSLPRLLAVGLVVGAGLLSKYTMLFVLPLVFGIFAVNGSFRQAVRYLGGLALIGLLFLAGWLMLANQLNVLQTQLSTVWEYAGLVLTTEYGRQVLFETMTNRLPSGLGVYNLPSIFLGGIFLINRRRKVDWVLLMWIFSVWLPLSLTLPDHRYFLPSFPAVALTAALGLQQVPKATTRGLLLALLLGGSTLYLYVDWVRAAELFVK
ncbi:MAG: glycosyltransferase family 39 protein [Chloroflexota bacterium]